MLGVSIMSVIGLIIIIGILICAIVIHEFAHGYVANQCGDSTAKMLGRLTLNPIKHIDPVGTLIVPGVLIALSLMGGPGIIFGWAKPVPVNFSQLRNPKRDMISVAIAGPAVNIAFALILVLFYKMNLAPLFNEILSAGIFINLLLAVFNMVPVPPLDGSRILMGLLPNEIARSYSRLEPYGLLIVVGLLYLGLFHKVVLPTIMNLGALLGVKFL